jgi:hypothetical protein
MLAEPQASEKRYRTGDRDGMPPSTGDATTTENRPDTSPAVYSTTIRLPGVRREQMRIREERRERGS